MAPASQRRFALLVSLLLLLACGCEKLRQDMNAWARSKSLRNNGSVQTFSGCPPGTEPEGRGPDGKPLYCKGVDSKINLAQEKYPNGTPKSEMIQNGESLIVVKYHPNGQRKEQITYLAAEKNGPYLEWSANGTKIIEAGYKQGALWGPYIARTEEGMLKSSGYYVAGKKTGVWTEYDRRGKVKSRVTWKNDQMTGNAEFYSGGDNPVLAEHGAFIKGVKTGRWIVYHDNGKQSKVGAYVNGKQHGDWIDYDQTGKVTNRSYYKYGLLSEKPRLLANVTERGRNTLGAEPPRQQVRPRPPRQRAVDRGPKPFEEPRGWSDL